jgi:ABC-2 type transport system ATP-binding protein
VPQPAPAALAVQTRGLTRAFGELTAVDCVDLAVAKGSIFGLLGPNGAGKTTLIRMLTTLLPPSAGQACVAGYDVVREAGVVRQHIGYVPQMLSADPDLTGFENLLIFAKLYRVPATQRRERIREALDFMGLTDAAGVLVRHYSGGMIRRLEIAQSLVNRPEVLFLDEPTVGLDPTARHAVWTHVQALWQRWGTTIFMTTHYMEEAEALCHAVAFVHHGRIVKSGPPAALKTEIGAATLDDVFIALTGGPLDEGGSYASAVQTRQAARRHG